MTCTENDDVSKVYNIGVCMLIEGAIRQLCTVIEHWTAKGRH